MYKYTVDLFRLKSELPQRVVTNNIDEIIQEVEKCPIEGIGINRIVIYTPEEKEKLIQVLNSVQWVKLSKVNPKAQAERDEAIDEISNLYEQIKDSLNALFNNQGYTDTEKHFI